MRIVAVAFLAAGCLLVAGGLLVPGPVVAESPGKIDSADFVYIPPPSIKSTDPRFFSDTYEFIPAADGQAPGKLVQPVWGAIPASAVKAQPASAASQSTAAKHEAPPPVPTSTATVAPKPTATQAPPANVTPAATQVPTAVPTVKPAPTKAPTLEPTAGAQQVSVSGTIPGIDDIEDPRFYRGSYVYDSETQTLKPGMIDGPPAIAKKSTPGSADECVNGSCNPPPPSQTSASFPRHGRAMYYNPGIMEQVLSFRLEANHVNACRECVGHVALLNRGDLNRKVWLEWADGYVEGPFLVIDCAAKQHVQSLLDRNWVVDVDYATARRRGMNNPVPVTVWDHRPSSAQLASGN